MTYRPYGIDLSSGIESSPGIKDPEKLRLFFEELEKSL
jgi:phosphoribosylanthranilate isomerase